jgi:hypothetical protein
MLAPTMPPPMMTIRRRTHLNQFSRVYLRNLDGMHSLLVEDRRPIRFARKDPRPPHFPNLPFESAGALWLGTPPARVSGASPFPRSRITAVKPADLFLPEKDPPTPGWGTLGFEFEGALWF